MNEDEYKFWTNQIAHFSFKSFIKHREGYSIFILLLLSTFALFFSILLSTYQLYPALLLLFLSFFGLFTILQILILVKIEIKLFEIRKELKSRDDRKHNSKI